MVEGDEKELFQKLWSKLPEHIQANMEDLQASALEHSLDRPLFGKLHQLAEGLRALPIKGSLQGRLDPSQVNSFRLFFPYLLEVSLQALDRAVSENLTLSTLERSMILSLMDLAFCAGHDYVIEHGPLLEPMGGG